MALSRLLGLGLLVLVVGSSGWLAAQPPRKEEEEETKDKARPVVPVPVVPDSKDPAPAKAPNGIDGDALTFKEEAAKAGHPDACELFRSLLNSYDRLTPNFPTGPIHRVVPLTLRELPEGAFEVQKLDGGLKNVTTLKMSTGSGHTLVPYELIVLEEVEKFLNKPKTTLSRDEQLNYATRAVAAGLRWHLLAVNDNKRVGKAWDEVGKKLRDRHLALLRERFNSFLETRPPKYDDAEEVGVKMLTRYPDNNEVLRDVYRLQLLRTRNTLKNPTDAQLAKLRESLLLYERLPGLKDETLILDSRRRLKDRASALVSESQDLDKKKMTAAALARLRQAEALDPEHPALVSARAALKGKVLYVGVSKLPERMSPATAESDSERWAVELMFEGLLQVVPDPDVTRYRPTLAESLPGVMPLGRSFTLPKNARWGRENTEPMDARDVRGTLDLLRRPALRDRWASDGIDVFEEINRLDDPFRLRLAYRHGVLEPLNRATFKVIPAQQLQAQGKSADDEGFARAPYGTGPFQYSGREMEGAERECAVFRANPNYGQRAGKFGLPWIREIRMFVPNKSSLVQDVAGGQLHLYADPPTEAIPRFRADPGLKDIMRVTPTRIDRRIHLIAINHRQTDLQNDKFRLGLSSAINREAILKDQFRPGDEKAHFALTGPFPVRCWATPPTAREATLFKAGAGGLMMEGLNNRAVRLRLTFLADNPRNGQVCDAIKTQIEQASVNKAGKPLVTIDLVPLPAKEYREKVFVERDFDLTLTTFDFRDDLYSLASLLDPEAAERQGRNFMGYLAQGTNPADGDRRLRKLLDETKQYRDFTKQVKDKTWDIHALFNQRVPFIPLWQLERYVVIHRDLELFFDNPESPVPPDRIDPAVLFTGVEMWRLK